MRLSSSSATANNWASIATPAEASHIPWYWNGLEILISADKGRARTPLKRIKHMRIAANVPTKRIGCNQLSAYSRDRGIEHSSPRAVLACGFVARRVKEH